MRYSFKITTMVCAVALMSACQTTPSVNRLDAEARPHLKKVDSVLFAPQYRVDADIKTSKVSQYLQGHVVPLLFDIGVNSIRSVKAAEYVKPVRETLDNYDYAYDIKEEFNLALENSGMGEVEDLKILRHEREGFRARMIRKSEADAVMFIDVNYAFSPTFDALNLKSGVLVYPINPELNDYKETPDSDSLIEYSDNIYRNQFMASIPVGAVETDGEETRTSDNAAVWAAMSAEELTGKLQEAAERLASHIAADMSTDEIEEIEEELRPEDPQDDHDEYLSKEPILADAAFTEAAAPAP